jgi:hypothetical protein
MYNILFSFEEVLAQHVSDVTTSIVRSTSVVYSHRFFYGFSNGINTPKTIKKNMAIHYSCTPED